MEEDELDNFFLSLGCIKNNRLCYMFGILDIRIQTCYPNYRLIILDRFGHDSFVEFDSIGDLKNFAGGMIENIQSRDFSLTLRIIEKLNHSQGRKFSYEIVHMHKRVLLRTNTLSISFSYKEICGSPSVSIDLCKLLSNNYVEYVWTSTFLLSDKENISKIEERIIKILETNDTSYIKVESE